MVIIYSLFVFLRLFLQKPEVLKDTLIDIPMENKVVPEGWGLDNEGKG